MIILGFDPGIATVGFGVIQSEKNRQQLIRCGAITTPAGQCLSDRLAQIYADATELIKIFKPDAIAIEELFFNTNITTGISVAHGRGVLLLAAKHSGTEIFEYTPLQVKMAIAGYGRAEKKQVMDMVKRLLRLADVPKPDDAADAVAIALCHARSSAVLMNLERGNRPCSTT